jgi:hypothetical protein
MGELSTVLRGAKPDAQQRQGIEQLISDSELEDSAAAPGWLLDLLTAVRDRQHTHGWVDFVRSESDDTNVLDFIRDLNQVLPLTYENNEESWMLTFPDIDIEACISLEGSCYKISEIGGTWVADA